MAKVQAWKDGNGYTIACPGCGMTHPIRTKGSGPCWSFNGDVDAPTFKPSLLRRSGHYAPHYKPGDGCWCKYNAEHPGEEVSFKCAICHSFITDGKIKFLSDCTHELAGQTVDLPDIGGA